MIWILISYQDGTGATTECDAASASAAIELMGLYFKEHMDAAYHDGACVASIKAIDPTNPADYAEIKF